MTEPKPPKKRPDFASLIEWVRTYRTLPLTADLSSLSDEELQTLQSLLDSGVFAPGNVQQLKEAIESNNPDRLKDLIGSGSLPDADELKKLLVPMTAENYREFRLQLRAKIRAVNAANAAKGGSNSPNPKNSPKPAAFWTPAKKEFATSLAIGAGSGFALRILFGAAATAVTASAGIAAAPFVVPVLLAGGVSSVIVGAYSRRNLSEDKKKENSYWWLKAFGVGVAGSAVGLGAGYLVTHYGAAAFGMLVHPASADPATVVQTNVTPTVTNTTSTLTPSASVMADINSQPPCFLDEYISRGGHLPYTYSIDVHNQVYHNSQPYHQYLNMSQMSYGESHQYYASMDRVNYDMGSVWNDDFFASSSVGNTNHYGYSGYNDYGGYRGYSGIWDTHHSSISHDYASSHHSSSSHSSVSHDTSSSHSHSSTSHSYRSSSNSGVTIRADHATPQHNADYPSRSGHAHRSGNDLVSYIRI